MGDFFLPVLWYIIEEGLRFVDRLAPRSARAGRAVQEMLRALEE